MNKSYMLVICLLAASFTGCLGSEDIEPSIVKEEDTIEPVGTGDNGGNETNNYNETNHYFYNNDTYYVNGTDYLELISQVENLTAEVEDLTIEVEELTEVLEEMQSSKYDVPENSSISIYYSTTKFDDDGQEYLHTIPQFEIIKSGNTLTIEYMGPKNSINGVNSNYFLTTPRNCTSSVPDLTVLTVDSNVIMSMPGTMKNYIERGFTAVAECTVDPDFENNVDNMWEYWTTITMTFAEEPVRIHIIGQEYTFE